MAHDNHTTDDSIREVTIDGHTLESLRKLARGWKDPFPTPVVEEVEVPAQNDAPWSRTFKVVRDDLPEVGSKGRFGSLLVQKMEQDTIVYVAPRVGWAPISLAKLAAMYDKRLVLFAPAAKEPSNHQRVAAELGAELRFYRVAAMPNLQKKAAEFAEKHGYFFAPLGLRHPMVTAAIVATAEKLAKKHGEPAQFWSAISTGVLSRGLQLAWPNAECHGVAVARNIKAGERGHAVLDSHPFPFTQDEKPELRPPFPSATNYDAKVWRYMLEHASDNAWFWNVAGEIQAQTKRTFKSDRPWGDDTAFRRR